MSPSDTSPSDAVAPADNGRKPRRTNLLRRSSVPAAGAAVPAAFQPIVSAGPHAEPSALLSPSTETAASPLALVLPSTTPSSVASPSIVEIEAMTAESPNPLSLDKDPNDAGKPGASQAPAAKAAPPAAGPSQGEATHIEPVNSDPANRPTEGDGPATHHPPRPPAEPEHWGEAKGRVKAMAPAAPATEEAAEPPVPPSETAAQAVDHLTHQATETVRSFDEAIRQTAWRFQEQAQALFGAAPFSGALFGSEGEAGRASRETLDAFSKASTALARGFEEQLRAVVAFTQDTMQTQMELGRQMLGARTVRDMAELQSDYARNQFSRLMHETTRLSEIALRTTNEAIAPISAQAAEAARRITGQD